MISLNVRTEMNCRGRVASIIHCAHKKKAIFAIFASRVSMLLLHSQLLSPLTSWTLTRCVCACRK